MTAVERQPMPEAERLAAEPWHDDAPDPYEVLGLNRYDTAPDTPGLHDDGYWASILVDEPAPAPEPPAVDEFWASRDSLARIHNFARARRVAPWAVLGAVLARVVVATEPNVQLPPIIGSHASLNLFVGLVGRSGSGKDAAAKVARDAIDVKRGADFITAPLGSGEGLSHMFMRETKDGPEQYNIAALVTIGEIDTLTALVKRQSSTVGSQLRQAAMGEQLGFFYVDTAKRMMVPEHRYRMCLLAGIQPKRAGSLLEESDGGTPQRFVWLPATDPDAPDVAPECPPAVEWIPPTWSEAGGKHEGGMFRVTMKVCQVAAKTIDDAQVARTRGAGDALDGHALLTRLKVAAALAILEGRSAVEDDDWTLAGVVMSVSDATRDGVVKVLAAENREQNKRQAEAEAVKTIVVQERVNEAAIRRVSGSAKRALAKNGGKGCTGAELRRAVSGPDKQFVDAALSSLVLAGDVVEEKIEYRGQHGVRYWLEGQAP